MRDYNGCSSISENIFKHFCTYQMQISLNTKRKTKFYDYFWLIQKQMHMCLSNEYKTIRELLFPIFGSILSTKKFIVIVGIVHKIMIVQEIIAIVDFVMCTICGMGNHSNDTVFQIAHMLDNLLATHLHLQR